MNSLVSDFDGTLFFSKKSEKVRKEDINKIREFQKQNLFGVCTGRPWIGISDLKNYDIFCDFYILTSGALILDKNQKVLFEKNISKSILKSLIEETEGYPRAIQSKTKLYTLYKKGAYPMEQTVIQSLDEMDEEATGFSVAAKSEQEARQFCHKFNEKYKVEAFQNKNFVDVVAKGCSKGTAVEFIKNYLNLEFVGAIGDSYNDIEMLKESDEAFTFHSSPNEVKKVSDYVVSGINQAIDIMTNKKE